MALNPLRQVFARDPLLMERGSQRDYGRAILEDLLVSRTIGTCLPGYADLHDRASLLKFERKVHTPSRPPDRLRAEYLAKRISRQPLRDDDVKELQKITMACKTAATLPRNDGAYPNHQAAVDDLTSLGARSEIAGRLRIAAVGFRVKISRLAQDGYLDEDLCVLPEVPPATLRGLPDGSDLKQLGRTTRLPRDGEDRWTKTIEQHIGKALDQGSHIVLLPEFALPSADRAAGDPLEERLHRAICEERGVEHQFLFAGSRHEGMYNRGLILSRKKQDACKGHWHYKIASAKTLGENILGPYGDLFPNYSVTVPSPDGGEMEIGLMVAICYDAFDPTMFLNLVLRAALQGRNYSERMILVPSFNPSWTFVELLRDLSFLAECPVIYVNGLHGDAKMYICGFAVSDLRDDKGRALLSHLKARIETTDRVLKDEHRAYLAECSRNPYHMRTTEQREWVESTRYRIEHLKTLRGNLENLQDARGLDHVITVEGCDACADNRHVDDYECGNDILYYNIDMNLVTALTLFRRAYFRDDSFLPEPFRRVELESAAARMEEVIRQRAANDG